VPATAHSAPVVFPRAALTRPASARSRLDANACAHDAASSPLRLDMLVGYAWTGAGITSFYSSLRLEVRSTVSGEK
jgi:hypothetical protein